jgi:D-amino-acid dehydrogenase
MAKRVAIVGSGVVGLCLAYSLNKRGWDVTLLEARSPGYGASRVNAGWICPSHSHPMPSPGLTTQSLKWMRSSDSPLYIKPRPSTEMSRWLFEFWRHCNASDFASGTEALAHLNRRTLEIVDEMRAAGVSFEEHRGGILHVYESPARLESEYQQMELEAREFELTLSGPYIGDDLREIEPSLSDAVYGGFWLEKDRQVRPSSFTGGLAAFLTDRGVTIRSAESVLGFEEANDRVTDLKLAHGRLETDLVVISAGVWSPALAAKVGRRVPVQAGKGYSLDYTPSPVEIRHAMHVDAARHAITPLDGMTRLAGTMEFSGINERIRPERVEAIIRGAARTIRGWPTDLRLPVVGTGLRPMSSDGLPLIGLLKGYRNLAIATGHGMLGMTLAPSTGEHLAEYLTTQIYPAELRPFDPSRF